ETDAGVLRGPTIMMPTRRIPLLASAALVALAAASPLGAQPSASTRVAILAAEDRRAPTPRDLAVIRGGLHGQDAATARIAVRALGRLENPAVVGDLLPMLRASLPEIRAEAANALGQAVQHQKAPSNVNTIETALVARAAVEADGGVRSA